MKSVFLKVDIPQPLWRLHGKQARVGDLLLTYLAAISATVFTSLSYSSDYSWEIFVLAVLSFDIGGGVISNFTDSTTDYYRSKLRSELGFILTHLVHIAMLVLVYDHFLWELSSIGVLILVLAGMICRIKDQKFQKLLSIFCLIGVIIILHAMPWLAQVISVLLHLFAIKLIVAFGIKWI